MLKSEVLNFLEENDAKFVRLSFCDPLGVSKNISIMASELENVYKNGRSIDVSGLKVFSDLSKSDLLLFPDLSSLSLLPWRPQMNSVVRFYCDIKKPNGEIFEADPRSMLKQAITNLDKLGFKCKIRTNCEFYLFKTNEFDEPTMKTLDEGSYLDIAPLDKGEDIRREICLCLEEMGLRPKNSHHENGPGQNQIDFKFSAPLEAADNFLVFKSLVKSIASRNGLFASFMPKPFEDKNGSGLHLNISLFKNGENVFHNADSTNFKYAKHFIAGILSKLSEISLFLNPNINSYERLGSYDTPKYISWAHQNSSGAIKIPIASNGRERMELRSPDPTVNPHIAFSLILNAGLYGIENKLELPPEAPINHDDIRNNLLENIKELPKNMLEAIEVAEKSDFVKEHLGHEFLKSYIEIKKQEYINFSNAIDKQNYYHEVDFKVL